MRRLWVVVMGVLILVGVNFSIYQNEILLSQGTLLLLELAPVDPRSLMQGDYMSLRYKIARDSPSPSHRDGYLILEKDENHVGHFKAFYEDQPLASNEYLLRFRQRRGEIQLGAESFFFQEGHASYYEQARYGELRLAPSGESILVGLRDEHFTPLGPPAQSVKSSSILSTGSN